MRADGIEIVLQRISMSIHLPVQLRDFMLDQTYEAVMTSRPFQLSEAQQCAAGRGGMMFTELSE